MNARERLELSHWKPEAYRTLKDAGIEFQDRAERIGAVVGWIGFTALIAAILFV